MALSASSRPCACPTCKCTVAPDAPYEHQGKAYCSLACADRHPVGAPCPDQNCHCEQASENQDRAVSESQIDQAVEESFPASDPISP